MQFTLADAPQINRQLKRTSEEEFWLKTEAFDLTLDLDLDPITS